jgi:hypothetical protein
MIAIAAGVITVIAVVLGFAGDFLGLPWHWMRPAAELLLLAELVGLVVLERHQLFEPPIKSWRRAAMLASNGPQRQERSELLHEYALSRFAAFEDAGASAVTLTRLTPVETFRDLLMAVTYHDYPTALADPSVRLNEVVGCERFIERCQDIERLKAERGITSAEADCDIVIETRKAKREHDPEVLKAEREALAAAHRIRLDHHPIQPVRHSVKLSEQAGESPDFVIRHTTARQAVVDHRDIIATARRHSVNQLLKLAQERGVERLFFVGDQRQHVAIEAGRPLRQFLEDNLAVARLTTIRRQRDPELKRAVELAAADVVRTVAFEPTLESVAVLGILVLIRTFLSLSTIVEIEGRWPWNGPRKD